MNFKKLLSENTINLATINAINLHDIIIDPNLEEVNSGKDQLPSKPALLIKIKEINETAKLLTTEDFDIKRQHANTAIIIGKGNYEGEVNLYYTVINFISKKLTDQKIYALATDSRDTIYRTQEDKVYKFTRAGKETLIDRLESGKTARNIVVDNEDNIYVGTDSGAVYKSNGTNRFTKISLLESKD